MTIAIYARDILREPELTIKSSDVERFCAVVGNQSEAYRGARAIEMRAPMDFAIVAGWQVREKLFMHMKIC